MSRDSNSKVPDIRDRLICPSAVAHEGAWIIGHRDEDRSMVFLDDPLPVTAEFIAKNNATDAPPLEKNYRFASRCLEASCNNWSNGACGLIERLTEFQVRAPEPTIVECSIRPNCRWFRQSGPAACSVCSRVSTRL